jgi:hypothetical protein
MPAENLKKSCVFQNAGADIPLFLFVQPVDRT